MSESKALRGLFEGFEEYKSVESSSYDSVIETGMVVIDTNVLLDLYRFNPEVRSDILAVLKLLGDRLWLPHQVLVEFWRNREGVIRSPRPSKSAVASIRDAQNAIRSGLDEWVARAALTGEQKTRLNVDDVPTVLTELQDRISELEKEMSEGISIKVEDDAVIAELSTILAGRVGAPYDHIRLAKEKAIAQERVARQIPPGFRDAKKDDSSGDYLLWRQAMSEAKRRKVDVLFVTGEKKPDWWAVEGSNLKGPRHELVREMRDRADVGFFMMRTIVFLRTASRVLKANTSERTLDAVEIVERVDDAVGNRATLAGGGWTHDSLGVLIDILEETAPKQAMTLRVAVDSGGFIGRVAVEALRGDPDRSRLTNFLGRLASTTRQLKNSGVIPDSSVDVMSAQYGGDEDSSLGFGWMLGYVVHPAVLPLLMEVYAARGDVD